MIKWLYLLFCKVGIHRFEKIDINYSFGPGGSTETIKCKDCGIKKIRKRFKEFSKFQMQSLQFFLIQKFHLK